MTKPIHFLIIGPAWVGDMVMTHGLFQLLKQRYPNCRIDVLAPKWTCPLLERMPEVNQALILPFDHGEFAPFKRWLFGKTLRNRHYDQAIVIPNSWKSAIVPFAARIKKRTGWLGEMRFGLLNDWRRLSKKKYSLMIQQLIALGLPPHSTLPNVLPYPKFIPKKMEQASKQPIIALCPGAEFGASKKWPEEYYAHIANACLEKHQQVWIFGSKNDVSIAEHIQALTQHRCNVLTGKTTLDEAIDLLSLAQLVITNDSGLMHIAAALDKNIIAIYGSTDPRFTPPLSNKANIVSIDLDCRPCFQRECPLNHHRCMRNLLPTKILEAMAQCGY